MADQERVEASLIASAVTRPRHEALVDGDRRCDYESLERWAREFALDLVASGVQPGDRVAIYSGQVAESVVALYGAWIAGAIAVPVHSALKSHQVAHILLHSGSRVLVSDARKLAQLDSESFAGLVTLEVRSVDAERRAPRNGDALDVTLPGGPAPAAILYTSGSTGRPKGILLSHENLRAGARIVASYLSIHADERILGVLPFSFDYGLNQLLTAVDRGATLVLQRSHFPADILRALATHRITALAGVPPLWIQLMQHWPRRHGFELPHLRYITNSGGVFPVPLVRRYRDELPHVRLYLMYGLSEAFRSTYLPPEELDRRPDSMGRAIPETDVLVLDAQNQRCAAGEAGELVHRGPTVALGYWNDPEATARVFRSDPEDPNSGRAVVYSGDVVQRDAEGFLSFVGRRDQLIKSFGHRISPDEVEELIHASRLVTEVVVHGRADEIAGAAIVAHVIPADPSVFQPRALLDYCRARMPAYMVPKDIEVHAFLPRTASGKVDRKAVAG